MLSSNPLPKRLETEWQAGTTTSTTWMSRGVREWRKMRGCKLEAATTDSSAVRRLVHTPSFKKCSQSSLRGAGVTVMPYGLQRSCICDFSRRNGAEQFQKVLHQQSPRRHGWKRNLQRGTSVSMFKIKVWFLARSEHYFEWLVRVMCKKFSLLFLRLVSWGCGLYAGVGNTHKNAMVTK